MQKTFALASLTQLLSACGGDFESAPRSDRYRFEVVARDITLVDGLAFGPQGSILATEEFRGGGVVRIDPVSGSFTYLARDLADADNIVTTPESDVFVTEEDPDGRIVRISASGVVSTFASDLYNPEGLDLGPNGNLFVVEHAPGGNVYRYKLNGKPKRLGQAEDGEGLRVLADGSLVIAETSRGRLRHLRSDGTSRFLAAGELESPDGVAWDPARNRLLITEDNEPGRLLGLDLESEELTVLAEGLAAPQTMLIDGDTILLAEQGADRILRLIPLSDVEDDREAQ